MPPEDTFNAGGPEADIPGGDSPAASGEPTGPQDQDDGGEGVGRAPEPPPFWNQQHAEQPDMPPWAREPGGQPQQATPPWQAPPQQPNTPNVDWRLLDQNYSAAMEMAIRARFEAPYATAPSEQDRATINSQYQLAVRAHQLQIKEVQQAQRDWYHQQREANFQQQALPQTRENAVSQLMKIYGLTRDEVAKDRRGREIWDPEVMVMLTEERAFAKYGDRVKGRQQSGADRPYAASGAGSEGGGDYRKMSDAQFEKHYQDVMRTEGRALRRVR